MDAFRVETSRNGQSRAEELRTGNDHARLERIDQDTGRQRDMNRDLELFMEEQLQVHGADNPGMILSDNVALMAKPQGPSVVWKRDMNQQGPSVMWKKNMNQDMNLREQRILAKKEKMKLQCTHCNRPGHLKADWFLLNGFPEWCGTQKGRGQGVKQSAHMVDTPLEIEDTKSRWSTTPDGVNGQQMQSVGQNSGPNLSITSTQNQAHNWPMQNSGNWQSVLANMVQSEIGKVLKGKGTVSEGGNGHMVNYAHFSEFAGSSVISHLTSNLIEFG
ncbi:OLC1v1029357C1 [Oldenlandia corymbosa var. corymbosa]|uniref:OLC1v1029357C1 n=1 Tax=Oldenlandia corymbosa var. corymbosa TaxID=529605 RepID=A0AAV1CED3_OLDCO|nr:OLC1v1029357C1 [Oldenlandia corymbosa var. corymbosa]